MARLLTYLTTVFVLLFSFSCGLFTKKTSGQYTIDPGIKKTIDEKITTINGVIMGAMYVKLYEKDSLIKDTYAKNKTIPFYAMSAIHGDTVNIICFAGMFSGMGFEITFLKDSCIIAHFAKSDVPLYKLHKTDSLDYGVSVPCKSYKLTLTQKPPYKKGDVVEGIVELISEDYYEAGDYDEEESVYHVQMTGYFKTNPLQNDMYYREEGGAPPDENPSGEHSFRK